MDGQTIECDISSAQKMLGQLNAQAVGTILQAAAQGVRNAAIKHFRTIRY